MERLKWIVGGYRFLWAVIGILGMTHHANCQIAMSSDLNCKFASPCRWQNSTTTMGRWFLADYLDIDNYYTIKPMSEKKEDFFVYASTHNGLPPAELVSDLVNCQLGGGRIKYWYYLTGKTSSLQICLRTPTSAGAPAAEPQCYNGLSSTRAHQWAFNTVELPPFSKPMEIVFRAFYGAPDDSIALDDIQYDAILCGSSYSSSSVLSSISSTSNSSSVHKRAKKYASWSTIPIVDIEKWNTMRMKIERDGKKPPLMLIVAKEEAENMSEKMKLEKSDVPEAEGNEEEPKTYPKNEEKLNFEASQAKSVPETSSIPTKTTTEAPTTSTTTSVTSTSEPTTTLALLTASESTTSTPKSTTDSEQTGNLLFGKATTNNPAENLVNFMTFFKQVAPVLPAIPSIIKSFSPETSLGLPTQVRASGVPTYTGGSPISLPGLEAFGGSQGSSDGASQWKLFGESLGGSSGGEGSIPSIFGSNGVSENQVTSNSNHVQSVHG